MRATDLIKLLAERIAQDGDLEVYVACTEPGTYTKAHEARIRTLPVHREHGRRTGYVDGAKAKSLGYDLRDHTHGIVVG